MFEAPSYVFGVVYLFTNLVNGKRYVGQSAHLPQRLGEHFRKAKQEPKDRDKFFQNSLRKHGKDNFEISVLCSCSTQEELDLLEDLYIVVFDTMNSDKGYNLKRGGARGKLSESGIMKIKAAKTGIRNPAFRADLPSAEELFRLYEETKSFLYLGKMFNANAQTIARRMRLAGFELPKGNTGKIVSKKARAKMSEDRQGKKHACYRHEVRTEEIVRMYLEEKLSTPQIGTIVNMTPRSIKLRLVEGGVILRTIAESLKLKSVTRG